MADELAAEHKAPPPQLDLLKLHQHLHGLFTRHDQRQALIPEFLYCLVNLINAGAASFESLNATEVTTDKALISRQAANWTGDLAEVLHGQSSQAIRAGQTIITTLPAAEQITIISVPITTGQAPQQAFSAALVVERQGREVFVLAMQFMATCFALWQQTPGLPGPASADPISRLANIAATTLTLPRGTAGPQLVAALKDYFQASMLILAPAQPAAKGSLIISSLTTFDDRSPEIRIIHQLIDECRQQQKPLVWPALPGAPGIIASLIVKEMAGGTHAGQTLCLPLVIAGTTSGVIVISWDSPPPDLQGMIAAFPSYQPFLAGLAGWLFRQPPSLPQRILAGRGRKTFAAALGLVAVLGLCLLPVSFTIQGDCLLKPEQVRFVVAQFDATLQEVHARPGNEIKAGEQLALLDKGVMELEINALQADIDKTRKLEDINTATGATAQAQMARLERQSLLQKLQLLEDRLSQLAITSPMDGMVISDSLDQMIGSPISRGQALFEIAPLARMVVEAHISQEDISYLPNKAEVRTSLDPFPGKSWPGTLRRIYPRSVIRDGENVFLVESLLANEDGRLRPGMRGRLEIRVGKRPLGWVYLRKPLIYLQKLRQSS